MISSSFTITITITITTTITICDLRLATRVHDSTISRMCDRSMECADCELRIADGWITLEGEVREPLVSEPVLISDPVCGRESSHVRPSPSRSLEKLRRAGEA